MTLLIAVLLVGLWIGVGYALLRWFARPGAGELQRQLSDCVCAVNGELTVTLRAVPPIDAATVAAHDVVLLLDRSGSMGGAPGSPFREMLRAAEAFTLRLPDPIHVAVVAFDHAAECVSPLTADKRRVVRGIGTIAPGGGTFIGGALNKAGEILNGSRPDAHRVVVLFSDGFDGGEDASSIAEALRSHPSKPAIYCATFGNADSMPLMSAIAGAGNRVFRTENFEGIVGLFDTLAAEVSGQRAVAGLLREDMRAPCPFALVNLGGSLPVDVSADKSTCAVWPLPQFDNVVTPISYVLRPLCAGWHLVVAGAGSITWRLPDGRVVTRDGQRHTRVLVLPAWAAWAWPIANPCLMVLIGRLIRCRPLPDANVGAPVPALPAIDVPPALPIPSVPAFRPAVRPAIVVGLGAAGSGILRHLRAYLRDRETEPRVVLPLTVEIGHPNAAFAAPAGAVSHAAAVTPGATRGDDAISLDADLWPYVDGVREQPLPELRTWLPIRKWLREGTPLTTLRGVPVDRAKARLCLLLDPGPVERALESRLAEHDGQDVQIILVGAVEDAETTGLLADIAHMFAARHKAVTCVLLPAPPGTPAGSAVAAFAEEMARFLVRRGEAVVSDRGGVPEAARQLFDRIFVLDDRSGDGEAERASAATLIWTLLAYRALDDLVLPARGDDVHRVQLKSWLAPQRGLWRWVRERLLSETIARRWLDRPGPAAALGAPDGFNEEMARHLVGLFWSGTILGRTAPVLIPEVAKVAVGDASGHTLVLAGHLGPIDRPYHEQKAFCDQQRNAFGYYLEAWCAQAFEEAWGNSRWGIPDLLAAARSVQAALSDSQEKLRPYAADANAANLASFTLAIILEMRALMSRLIEQLEAWHDVFLRRQPNVDGAEAGPGVVASIQAALDDAESGASLWSSLKGHVEPDYQEWSARQNENLLRNLRFAATYVPNQGTMKVELNLFGTRLAAHNDIARALRSVIDPFRPEILGWPLRGWLAAHRPEPPGGGQWHGFGLHADRIFGTAVDVVEKSDPAAAIAIAVETMKIRDALECARAATADDYIWAEEANAERTRALTRALLHTDSERYSPLVVSLLRRPSALLRFLRGTASGDVAFERGDVVLRSRGRRFVLSTIAGNAASVADFEAAAERAILLEEDKDGRGLPDADPAGSPPSASGWRSELDQFVDALDNSPIGRAIGDRPEWAMWRDVAKGVFLHQVIR
jgi:uncharacterized protein YegL